jgi:proteic killer suppression protein
MEVILSKNAEKQLQKTPAHIRSKLMYWTSQVDDYGIEEVRKIPGFHDEPLKGKRKGQRSVRLSKSWRAIYEIIDNIIVIEVHHHDY